MSDNFENYKRTRAKMRRKEKCKRKVKYATFEEAEKHSHWQGMVAYECPFGKHFHVGNPTRPVIPHRS